MSVKEKPLLDAVSKVEPLPKFLFSHPILAGFFSMIMCAVFGSVAFLFLTFGGASPLESFEIARWGSIVGIIIGAIAHVSVFVSGFLQREEFGLRLQVVFGGVLAIALLGTVDRVALESVRAWLAPLRPYGLLQ